MQVLLCVCRASLGPLTTLASREALVGAFQSGLDLPGLTWTLPILLRPLSLVPHRVRLVGSRSAGSRHLPVWAQMSPVLRSPAGMWPPCPAPWEAHSFSPCPLPAQMDPKCEGSSQSPQPSHKLCRHVTLYMTTRTVPSEIRAVTSGAAPSIRVTLPAKHTEALNAPILLEDR